MQINRARRRAVPQQGMSAGSTGGSAGTHLGRARDTDTYGIDKAGRIQVHDAGRRTMPQQRVIALLNTESDLASSRDGPRKRVRIPCGRMQIHNARRRATPKKRMLSKYIVI